MSKNMKRSVVALGSGLALIGTSLVAAPAYAVENISLTPYWGAGDANELVAYTDLDGGIVLSTELANIGSATASNLKYQVEILNDNTSYEAVNDGTGANFASTNVLHFYSNLASKLDGAGNDLSAHAATENTVTADDEFVVVTPNYKDTSPSAITTASQVSITGANGSATPTIEITIPAGHDFTEGDLIALSAISTGDSSTDLAGDYTLTAVGATTVSFNGPTSLTAADNTDNNDVTGVSSDTIRLKTAVTPAVGQNHLLYIETDAFDDYDTDTTADDTLSIRVTAWIDETSDNAIGNEYKSASVDITFLPTKSVTVTPTLDYAFVGQDSSSTPVTGDVSMNLNMRNFLNVNAEENSNTLNVDLSGTATSDEADITPTYDTVNDILTFSGSSAGTLIAGTLIATVEVGSSDATGDSSPFFTGSTTTSEVTTTLGAVTAETLDLSLAVANSATNETSTATLIGTNETEILEGTKRLPFTVTVWDDKSAGTPVGSGVDVKVTLTDNGLGTSTLTTESKSLEATGVDSISFTKKTNSSGQISFTVAADNAIAGESFTLNATAEDFGFDGVSKTAQTVTFSKRDYTVLQIPSDQNFQIVPGGTLSVDYRVVDQFGFAPDGNFQLAVTRGSATGDRADDVADQAEWSYAVPVSDSGRATVTITDNGSTTVEGADTVTVTLQEAATAGGGYITAADPDSDSSNSDTFTLTYELDMADLSVDAAADYNGVLRGTTALKPVKLEPDTLVDFDARISTSVPQYDADNADDDGDSSDAAEQLTKISGTVTNSSNTGVSGVAVQLTAEGLNFATADRITYDANLRMLNDSITLITDSSGAYEAFVRSSVAGKQTIDVSAQGATASVDVTFEGSTGTADSMTLDLASSVVDGRTADVKATVVDALGNPVSGLSVTFKEEGPGYLNSATGTTDAEGEVIVNLITLSGDTGTSTISATATIDGETTTVSDTIVVGTVASADQKVNAGTFKGFVALYAKGYEGQRMSAIVAGKWLEVESLDSNYERIVRFTGAGYDIKVRIYIDGVQVGPEFDITTI